MGARLQTKSVCCWSLAVNQCKTLKLSPSGINIKRDMNERASNPLDGWNSPDSVRFNIERFAHLCRDYVTWKSRLTEGKMVEFGSRCNTKEEILHFSREVMTQLGDDIGKCHQNVFVKTEGEEIWNGDLHHEVLIKEELDIKDVQSWEGLQEIARLNSAISGCDELMLTSDRHQTDSPSPELSEDEESEVECLTMPEDHVCSKCGQVFPSSYSLRVHMVCHSSESNDKKHTCAICDDEFSSPESLLRHILTHLEETHHVCMKCLQPFSNKDKLEEHMLTHSEPLPSLRERGHDLLLACYVVEHLKSRTRENSHKCNECGKAFLTATSLKVHRMSHPVSNANIREKCRRPKEGTDVSYMCLVCSKTFSQHTDFRRHVLNHAESIPEMFTDCAAPDDDKSSTVSKNNTERQKHDKNFSSRSQLRNHWEGNVGAGSYPCVQCGKVFSSQNRVDRHQLSHAPKPYKCKDCHKTFADPRCYKTHVNKVHTGEKPYPCSQCDLAFPDPRERKRHVANYHMGEKRHKCPECEKTFFSALDCNRHVMRHKGEKPHKCSVCGCAFLFPWALKSHMLTHSGKKQVALKCHECGMSYSHPRTLQMHITKRHGKNK